MAADTQWPRAVPRVILDVSWLVAAGDESTEVQAVDVRATRLSAAHYATPSHVPPSPAEPAVGEPEPDYRNNPVPLIPLQVPGTMAVPAPEMAPQPVQPAQAAGEHAAALPPLPPQAPTQQQQQQPVARVPIAGSAAEPSPTDMDIKSLLASIIQTQSQQSQVCWLNGGILSPSARMAALRSTC